MEMSFFMIGNMRGGSSLQKIMLSFKYIKFEMLIGPGQYFCFASLFFPKYIALHLQLLYFILFVFFGILHFGKLTWNNQ